MFVLVGLGNPGIEYQTSRHNLGFMLLDYIAQEFNISISQSKFKAITARSKIQNHDCFLVKPQTYMNLSGKSVLEVLNYFKVPETHLIVLSDDLDLSFGQVKTRFGGGHGGHNGILSLLESLSSDQFYRIKMGIGKPTKKSETSDWVLHSFNKTELDTLFTETFPLAKERILNIMNESRD